MKVAPMEVQHLQNLCLTVKVLFDGRRQHPSQAGSGYFYQVEGLKDYTEIL